MVFVVRRLFYLFDTNWTASNGYKKKFLAYCESKCDNCPLLIEVELKTALPINLNQESWIDKIIYSFSLSLSLFNTSLNLKREKFPSRLLRLALRSSLDKLWVSTNLTVQAFSIKPLQLQPQSSVNLWLRWNSVQSCYSRNKNSVRHPMHSPTPPIAKTL